MIRGSRASVRLVIASLALGMTSEEVERAYDLSAGDIRAALKFLGERGALRRRKKGNREEGQC